MKKLSILFGLLLVLGMTVPAMAEISVYGEITKDKEINVEENVLINKNINIDVTIDEALVKAAEADSLLNQENSSNDVHGIGTENNLEIDSNFRYAIIEFSINDNKGIVGVNQDAGNMNNQANVVSIAVALEPAAELPAFANAQASAGQNNRDNNVTAFEDSTLEPLLPQKVDRISDSISRNTGIVGVNQSVGNMNNQANQVALAVADNTFVALSEANLGQFNAYNRVLEFGTVKTDIIANSINYNTGIVGVNQSAGNMNNQANVVSIAATIPR